MSDIFRLIVRVDNMGPEGQPLSPTYRTVIVVSQEMATAMKCGTYSHAGVVGVEVLDDEVTT